MCSLSRALFTYCPDRFPLWLKSTCIVVVIRTEVVGGSVVAGAALVMLAVTLSPSVPLIVLVVSRPGNPVSTAAASITRKPGS
jgi:hypothetical protein